MRYRLTYQKQVLTDVYEAKVWYHNQLPGLEKKFARDIRKTIARLKTSPFTHAIRYRNIRIAHPDVFPYGVHYYVDEAKKQIIIIGILHNSRDNPFLNQR